MEQDIYKTDEQFILLNNINSEDRKCDFQVNFQKTINIQEPSECALYDVHLPSEIVVNTFKERRKLSLTVFWNYPEFRKHLEYGKISYNSNHKYFDAKINLVMVDEQTFDYYLEPTIKSLEDLLDQIETIENEMSENFKLFYLRNYYHAELIDGLNYFRPRLIYENGKFRKTIGQIRFRGIHNDWIKQQGFTTIEEYYQKKTEDFFKYTTLKCFINFDQELHEILGFDAGDFPSVIKKGPDEYTVEDKNNGIAVNNFDLGCFNLIYVYTDIVKESYCGDTKANLLKVFSRKNSKNQIIPYHFNNLLFIPLRVSEINSIRILCADCFGETLTYMSGHISLTLVIRPIENV